jgi:hypothetical protein
MRRVATAMEQDWGSLTVEDNLWGRKKHAVPKLLLIFAWHPFHVADNDELNGALSVSQFMKLLPMAPFLPSFHCWREGREPRQ